MPVIPIKNIAIRGNGGTTTAAKTVDGFAHGRALTDKACYGGKGTIGLDAIGIGDGINVDFMARLARDNNGEFRRYLDDGKKQS